MMRKDLQKGLYEAEEATEYMNASKRIQIAVKKASKVGMDRFLLRGDKNLSKQNHSKRVYQLIKDLISSKKGRSTTIQNRTGKCLTEETEILSRWTEYCSELYNHERCGDNIVLDCSQPKKKKIYY